MFIKTVLPLFLLVAFFWSGLVYAKRMGWLQAGASSAKRPRARQLLTANELEFLQRLESAAPELRFHAQVSMGALLEPSVRRSDGREYMRQRGTFSQKVVDFVAQDRAAGTVVAIIELDDKTHNSARDKARDEMLVSAGYRTVRWDSRKKPDAPSIRAALLAPASPSTPAPADKNPRSARKGDAVALRR